jgi:hypothetical protein
VAGQTELADQVLLAPVQLMIITALGVQMCSQVAVSDITCNLTQQLSMPCKFKSTQHINTDHILCLVCCLRSPVTAGTKEQLRAVGEQEPVLVCEERIEDGDAEGDAAASCKAQVGCEVL